ncbi:MULTISPECIES: PRC-barrel domain-containing protein [Aureimonas]|jgi:sporulation protein YlmC with PRC-barrel domain|uniref:Sporulation protein YlmC, PRC-barrel domain family n=1 Tax=Aureimonas jatrophae TaxID=1166073 RepID=A0A1H0I8H0_9HYPH|nr:MULTISPECIES: PRC-barrel domain-containing protein [Aureimonas]MBB3952033.1 sporulation protein YlmC with PRC-barrel domain [Aureimonas jatrophae]SDO27570.1 Sporulation protein YlmC, PRC-barrel domain family [Aureimonas jatrophae]
MSSTMGTGPVGEVEVGADAIEASRVNGTAVYNTEGDHLGHIYDVVIGKRDGRVKYAIMSFGGFLGIGEEYHPLPWEVLKYDERQGGYVVGITIDQLQSAPRYGADARPDWATSDYGRRVNDYYGVAY